MIQFWEGSPSDNVEMPVFDKTRVKMQLVNSSVAKDFIVKNHYAHTWPVAVICFGFYIDEKLNGMIIYGHSASAKMANSLPSKNYLELQRLYSFDWAGRNIESYMISQTIKYIKQNHPEIECLVSFADPEQNHAGIIYQATNWIYCGISVPSGGYQYFFDGKWQHIRSTSAKYGTREHEKIMYMFPDAPHRKVIRKHRYIYLLPKNKRHKKELMKALTDKYEILPYPKLNKNVI